MYTIDTTKVGKLMLVVFIIQLVSYYFLLSQNGFTRLITGNQWECNKANDTEKTKVVDIFNITMAAQNDPVVLNYIRQYHLVPPSTKEFVKKGTENVSDHTFEIMNIFKNKQNGFFIEAGANDGIFLSNTLDLERKYNWTGLLIEPNPFMLVKLRLRNRKAWIADVCLSLTSFSNKVRFVHRIGVEQWKEGNGVIESAPVMYRRDPNDYVYAGVVECFPLYSLVAALNPKQLQIIDYLSLDMQGIELSVLKAIPFDKLVIKVMSIEYDLIPEGLDSLLEFLKSKQYQLILKKNKDVFVAHKDYLHEFNISQ